MSGKFARGCRLRFGCRFGCADTYLVREMLALGDEMSGEGRTPHYWQRWCVMWLDWGWGFMGKKGREKGSVAGEVGVRIHTK